MEKLTELVLSGKKNGIHLCMSFIFCTFVADFVRTYNSAHVHIHIRKHENSNYRIWKDGAYD